MYSMVNTATVYGIESRLCRVEADISEGMPMFEMVGYLGSEVREAKERVRAALRNAGFSLPIKRITVNLAPANLKKSGSGFDLPIAIAILAAIGIVEADNLDNIVIVGEISLDGRVMPLNGVLPMALEAFENDKKICIVPWENVHEAALVPGLSVIGVRTLKEALDFLNNGVFEKPQFEQNNDRVIERTEYDFSMINGQHGLRRACEVAISGMHNLLMVGPPGSGKTMVAKCIPGILPPMTLDEQMELSKIYSVCGKFSEREGLISQRPFRNPHHTITEQGLIGGGVVPRPGEISLSHGGVLFLDEFTEFKKTTIEVLRQPLEEKTVSISRASGTCTFPADFLLCAAMNPCNCGYYPDQRRCHCSQQSISRYINKISQPVLDRIDICVEAPTVSYEDIVSERENESSAEIRARVVNCQSIQLKRYEKYGFSYNSQIPGSMIDTFCPLGEEERIYMEEMYESYDLTARTYHKVLKVARTIADMAQRDKIALVDLYEALSYKGLEKRYWEG